MFELSISISADSQMYIHEFYKSLDAEVKRDKGIMVKQIYAGRISLAIAVPPQKREYYKSKILEQIIYIIIDYYKFNFYKENLQIINQNVICQSFLKAISIFDAELDREVIKRQIDFGKEVIIDSFYYFKLQPLRARWLKTAGIINQNQILSSQSSMLGVLRYLTMTSENILMCAQVTVSKKQIKMKGFSTSRCFKKDFDGQSDFLTEIVRLNPVKIDLKLTSGEEDSVVEFLNRIFDDKIYFVK